jgi:hypothetical protein
LNRQLRLVQEGGIVPASQLNRLGGKFAGELFPRFFQRDIIEVGQCGGFTNLGAPIHPTIPKLALFVRIFAQIGF